jgi:RNA recognition motif-containing protein
MSVRLFVGNLPYDVTEIELRELFAPAGALSSVVIPVDRETGKRRGFAFVEFADRAQAEDATKRFNNQPFKGRTMTVNEARARESRPDGGPPRSGSDSRMGSGGFSRPSFSPRPSLGPVDFSTDPMSAGKAGERRRNFGPDSKPAHKRKQRVGPKTERGAMKRPLRERVGGQFFGSPEDALYEEDWAEEKFPELKKWEEDDE